MGNCTRCGRLMDGEGMCDNCTSLSAHPIGTPEEVPCQRCGMYLPPHELRMWNSRLYCAYCIMDIQDEDARSKAKKEPEAKTASEEGRGLFSGLFGRGEGKESGSGAAKSDELRYQQYSRTAAGMDLAIVFLNTRKTAFVLRCGSMSQSKHRSNGAC